MRIKWQYVALVLAFLFAGAYFGSAYNAARNLKAAAISGEVDQLETAIDFQMLRTNMKAQLGAAMLEKMTNDPEMRGNPFAKLGMAMAPAFIDKAVDAYLTPESIAALVKGEKARSGAVVADNGSKTGVDYSYHWNGLDRFRVEVRNPKTNSPPLSLLFARHGLFGWKLYKIDMTDIIAQQSK
jgi:hypothetical protein